MKIKSLEDLVLQIEFFIGTTHPNNIDLDPPFEKKPYPTKYQINIKTVGLRKQGLRGVETPLK